MRVVRRVRGLTSVAVACLCLSTAFAGVPAGAGGGGGGVPVLAGFTSFDLADVGYERSEVFLSGTATSYAAAEPFGADGRFAAEPATTAPYVTRAVVVKPQHRSDFNGTVVVEWLNVSGGADTGADWMQAHTELIREGYAWVGVSAQKVGVDALRGSDPQRGDAVRYAGLTHPGDSFSYDIYSQAGRAIRRDRAVLGRFRPDHVIAVGESQSAGRLVTYIDAVHPLAGVYDGFLVHSRRDGGAPLSQAPQADVPVPAPAPIRDDLDEPVLVFQAETDVLGGLAGTRRPDTDTYRLWEVAGTAPVSFLRDADGNALGGIRTPAVDAPVAALSGVPAPGGTSFCFLFGTTVPFTPERLAELYPTHRSFVQAWRQAAHEARRAGFLTRTDANHLVAAAAASDIGT